MKMLDLILTSQKYANVTPLDSMDKYLILSPTDPQRSMLNINEFVFPGFDLFRPFAETFLQDL